VGDAHHFAYLDRLGGEARRLVKRHRTVIEKFAELLLQRKELERSEAEEFIRALLGRCTDRRRKRRSGGRREWEREIGPGGYRTGMGQILVDGAVRSPASTGP
jgi:hypothetical protein